MIGIEVSQWQYLREKAQSEADKIALEVAQYLPFKEAAFNNFLVRANAFNSRSENLKISLDGFSLDSADSQEIDAGKIRIRITGQQDSVLDSLLAAVTGEEVIFPVEQTASARVVPTDFMLVISDDISMRPAAFSTFGNELEFPQSSYFNQISLPALRVSPPPTPPRAWPEWWNPTTFNNVEFQRWSTQLCFNPITLPLKTSALMLVDVLAASSQNKLGVYATPGDVFQQVGFSVIKELSYSIEHSSPVNWSNYFEPDVPNSDEACLYYSSSEIGVNSYPIPNNLSDWQESTSCSEKVIVNPLTSPIGHYPSPINSGLSPCFLEGGASLREAIYYRSVRMHPHEILAKNVSRTMKSALSKLIEGEKIDPTLDEQFRGGLVGNANKVLVVISDLVPELTDPNIQEVLNGFRSDSKIKIYLFAYNHQNLNPVDITFNNANIAGFASLNEERLFARSVNEKTLIYEIRALLSNEKQVVISS